jgi:PAS domain S-box-containing protein
MREVPPFVLLLLLTAVASLVVTLDVVRRRPARGVLPFVAMTLGTAWYALSYALQLASLTLPEKLLWARLQYLGVMALPAGLLAFANRYTERKSWLRWQSQILLAVEPVITLVLLWTNDLHHWVWTAAWLQPYSGSSSMLGLGHGPWFWIHLAYSYGLILWAFGILGRAFVRYSHVHRRQLGMLFVSFALPLLGYTLVIAGWNPFAPIDPTPFWAALGVILAGWGLRRYRIFDLLPIARHAVVEQIDEGMVVVNAEGDIVDVNAAVLRLLGRNQAQVIGQPASPLLPFYDELDRRHCEAPDVHEEVVWSTDPRRYFDLHRSALYDRHGRLGGHLFVLHDITVRREAEEQARQRSQELSALYEIALELTTPRDLTHLLQLIVQRATDLVHGSSGGVYLYRPERDDLKYEVVYGAGVGWEGTVLKRGEGVSGRVLESGQAQAVDDYSHWPGRSAQYDGVPLGAVVAVPMQWEGGILGVLDVGREPGHAFSPEAIRLLTLFANQAALLIVRAQLSEAAEKELGERRRAERELQQRSQELSTLYDTALEVASQLDLSRLLQGITERAMQLLQASTGDLSLYRPESDDLEAAVLCGVAGELTGTVLKRGEGMGGRVLETGGPLAVEDYRTWPGRARAYDGLPFGPMVGAPLKWGGQVLGTIDVARQAGPVFTEAETRLLSLFANQAAVAIINARHYAEMRRELTERRLAEEQVRRRSQELSELYDTSLEVASRLDLVQLLPTIVERAALLLRATGSGMYLYQEKTDTLEHVVGYGLSKEFIRHTLRRGEGICGKVLDSGQPMTVDDYHHWAGRSPLFDRQEVGAVLAVPVKWGERVLGVIDLQRDAGAGFTPEETRLLILFASQAAIAVANAQLYEAARRELAERKSAEAQLQQAQRMEAVGILAGGVAHEFNNLLTVIEGNVELAMADLDANHPGREALSTVVRTAQRAAVLTKQLLAFSRSQELEARELDLNALLANFAAMVKPALGPGVDLRLDPAPGIKPVLADAGAVEQVLMNLALNARDAMPQGGQLRIATAAAALDEEFCGSRANLKPGEYVRLTVSDTGTGMDDETLRHLFEPFFTTKEVGKGTGLGLCVVYGIIRQHEGLIEAQSEVGCGTRFDVYLPVFTKQ